MKKIKCPCCGNYTINNELGLEVITDICSVCHWQYDEVAHDRPDKYVGGANKMSLSEARKNYLDFGAKDRKFIDSVRNPYEEELPENNE